MKKGKHCPGCDRAYTRSLTNFHRNRSKPDGLQTLCRHGCHQDAVARSTRKRAVAARRMGRREQ